MCRLQGIFDSQNLTTIFFFRVESIAFLKQNRFVFRSETSAVGKTKVDNALIFRQSLQLSSFMHMNVQTQTGLNPYHLRAMAKATTTMKHSAKPKITKRN